MKIQQSVGSLVKKPFFSILLALIILYLDYITGPEIQFPFLFIAPVILITCYNDLWWGLALSVLLPIVSVYFIFLWNENQRFIFIIINLVIRIIIFAFIAVLINVVKKQKRELSERINNLESFLPICSFCKKIRDEKNHWHNIENYISGKTSTEFSHSICPDCAKKYYKDYIK